MTRTISLPQYEGPLDLLLDLVRQNKLDILNLPIAEVTRQFLDYMAAAGQLDLDLDSEWFHMAALLIHIKSRSLLPVVPENQAPDPRHELVRQLLDRDQLAGAAGFLQSQWSALGGWPPPPAPDPFPAPASEDNPGSHGSMTLLEVLELARKALTAVASAEELAIPSASVPMEEMLALIDRHLDPVPQGAPLDFTDLWRAVPTDQHRSALFLALLEAARARQIDLQQDGHMAPILIRRPPSVTSQRQSW
jgi:segregation and condensation protein A